MQLYIKTNATERESFHGRKLTKTKEFWALNCSTVYSLVVKIVKQTEKYLSSQ